MRDLFGLIKYKWRYYLLGAIALLLVDGAQLIIPLVVGKAIDRIATFQITPAQLFGYFLVLAGLGLFIAVVRFFWRWFIIKPAREIQRDLRQKIYRHLLYLDVEVFHRMKTGDIMAKATNDLEAVRMAISFGLIAISDTIIYTTFALVAMLSISPRLTLITMTPLLAIAPASLFFGRAIHRRFRRVQDLFGKLSEFVRETLEGIHVVRAFAKEDEFSRQFRRLNDVYLKANIDLVKVWGAFFPLITMLSGFSIAVLLLWGGISTIEMGISIGQFVAFLTYLNMLVWPMMGIGWSINMFQRGSASYRRIKELLSIPPREYRGRYRGRVRGNVRFEHLHFSYDGKREVLRDITFEVKEGQTVGILGRIGSGKSTLVKLLLRLYEPPHGTIFVDGVDVRDWDLRDLREGMAYVPQESFLFSMTIRENLLFGNPDATEEEIIEACKIADVWKDIERMPDGLDTMVGERGITLSGGQKQRLSIARAILKRPKILILDDAFSAIDSETEKAIIERLRDYIEGITTFIISHRIASTKDAHLIIVMEKGMIAEMGTHDSLVRKGGIYYNIWKMQTLAGV